MKAQSIGPGRERAGLPRRIWVRRPERGDGDVCCADGQLWKSASTASGHVMRVPGEGGQRALWAVAARRHELRDRRWAASGFVAAVEVHAQLVQVKSPAVAVRLSDLGGLRQLIDAGFSDADVGA